MDAQDVGYCSHDQCYGHCAVLPTAWQRLLCRTECDSNLAHELQGVFNGSGNNWKAAIAAAGFSAGMGSLTSIPSDEQSTRAAEGCKCR